MKLFTTKLFEPAGRRGVIDLFAVTAVIEGPRGEAYVYVGGLATPIITATPFDVFSRTWKKFVQRHEVPSDER